MFKYIKKKLNQDYGNNANPILAATKITNNEVISARVLLVRNFIFKKLPTCPPIKTIKNKGQKFRNSLTTTSFVSCPATPNIELIKINKDAVVAICFGYPAFIKNKNGLKNIPPPIPIIPETKPIIDPIRIDIKFGILFNLIISLLKDLLSINRNIPATTRTINKIISNNSFDIGIDAPTNASGIEPTKYGTNNLKLRLPDLI